jgi:hypothetical protein
MDPVTILESRKGRRARLRPGEIPCGELQVSVLPVCERKDVRSPWVYMMLLQHYGQRIVVRLTFRQAVCRTSSK